MYQGISLSTASENMKMRSNVCLTKGFTTTAIFLYNLHPIEVLYTTNLFVYDTKYVYM